MAGYGVGGADWRGLPWSWASERLVAARNYWLVTVSADHRPHALPVWGVWHETECRFAFSCAPSSRKAVNLTSNPHVSVSPEDTVECVSVEGRARQPSDERRRQEWIERYLAKYLPISPGLTAGFLQGSALFEVEPLRAFGIVEREEDFATRATRWRFG